MTELEGSTTPEPAKSARRWPWQPGPFGLGFYVWLCLTNGPLIAMLLPFVWSKRLDGIEMAAIGGGIGFQSNAQAALWLRGHGNKQWWVPLVLAILTVIGTLIGIAAQLNKAN